MVGALYSINRPHTDNIKSGLKLWEIRKSKPNIPVPFPAFIYETKKKGGCGKVIGEFICDEIIQIRVFENGTIQDWNGNCLERACISYDEMANYIGFGKIGYGLQISNLKIYDKPKELSEFRKAGFMTEEEWLFNLYPNTHCHYEAWAKKFEIKNPPQSFFYVEELSI